MPHRLLDHENAVERDLASSLRKVNFPLGFTKERAAVFVSPSDFQVLQRGSVAAGGGAFLGYNTQWQDLVLGR
jgi:hypothetical protein